MFFYFIEKEHRQNFNISEVLVSPIRYAFEGETSCLARHVDGGPGGKPGYFVCRNGCSQSGYYPDVQEWMPLLGIEGVYFGVEKGIRPTPDSLAKTVEWPSSYEVECEDGNLWRIPVAIVYNYDPASLDRTEKFLGVPSSPKRDESGKWTLAKPLERYRELWEAAGRYENLIALGILSGKEIYAHIDQQHRDVITAISTFYYIGPDEVEFLTILSERTVRKILGVLIDSPTREEWYHKKKERDLAGINTSAGSGD